MEVPGGIMYRSLVFLIAVAILISRQAHATGEWEAIQKAKSSAQTLGDNTNKKYKEQADKFNAAYAEGVKAEAKAEGVSEDTVRGWVAQQNGGTAATGSTVYDSSSLSNATGTNTATLNSGTTTSASMTSSSVASGSQRDALNAPLPTQGTLADGRAAIEGLRDTGTRCANEFGKNSARDMTAAYNVIPMAIASIQQEGPTTTPARVCARIIQMAGLNNIEYLMCAAEGRPCPGTNPAAQPGYQDPALLAAISQSQAAEAARQAREQQLKMQAEALAKIQADLQKQKEEEEQNNALMLMLMYAVGGNSQDGGGPDIGQLMQFIKSAD